tara:strand:- start:395 stop:862 length:468 start_codon:yes stop_codon:yes gene_type:complete
MKLSKHRLLQIIQEEYSAMTHTDKEALISEGVISEDKSQSEAAISAIEAVISNTLNTLLKDLVPASKINSMLDNAKNAVEGRIADDLRDIYQEPPPTAMVEAVMTQEPIDVLEELRSLTSKLSSISGDLQPYKDIASDMISQINDLEELLTTEEQ